MKNKKEIIEFSDWILNIGNGTIDGIKDDENEDITWIEIPQKYILYFESNLIETISNSIYNDFINNFDNIKYLKERAIVAPKYKTVEYIYIYNYMISLVPNEKKNVL